MSRKGENIYKRKDGRWEGRYIKAHDIKGKAQYVSGDSNVHQQVYHQYEQRFLKAEYQ